MEDNIFKRAVKLFDEIEHVKAELLVWSRVSIPENGQKMPHNFLKMWAPSGVAADYTVDSNHAQAIKDLHVNAYTKRLELLEKEFNDL